MHVGNDIILLSFSTVKKTFKFLGHKRTSSAESWNSQGPATVLGGSNSDMNNLCINGSHVYTEETKTSSDLSLKSIRQGSLDVLLKHTSDADNRHFSCMESDREILEQQWHLWQEEKMKEEEKGIAEAKILEEEEKYILEEQCHLRQEEKRQKKEKCIAEAKILEEEEKYRKESKRLNKEEECRSHKELEKKSYTSEGNAQREKQGEEEEQSTKQEEELEMLELAVNQKLEEECCREEEQKREEEVSMSTRLTSLFGIIRKKKEDFHQDIKDELPTQTPLSDYNQPISHYSTSNTFDDIPLNSDPVGTAGPQKASVSHQVLSGRVFLNRTAKVSAVKPR